MKSALKRRFKARSTWHGNIVKLTFRTPKEAHRFQNELNNGCLVFEDTSIKTDEELKKLRMKRAKKFRKIIKPLLVPK